MIRSKVINILNPPVQGNFYSDILDNVQTMEFPARYLYDEINNQKVLKSIQGRWEWEQKQEVKDSVDRFLKNMRNYYNCIINMNNYLLNT
jgi:hypothetical protein